MATLPATLMKEEHNYKTILGEDGYGRIKIREGLLSSEDYSRLQRLLQNFTEGYVMIYSP